MANDKFTQKRDIHERIYKFALSVLKVTSSLPRTTENMVLVRQVTRSSGSVGANASEADGAETKKEFVHRFTICKKEAKETLYWLSLLSDHNTVFKKNFLPIIAENKEIIAIVSKIIINAQKN